MKKGFLVGSPQAAAPVATPPRTAHSRRRRAPLDLNTTGDSLADAARSESALTELESVGYAVLPLSSSEAEMISMACSVFTSPSMAQAGVVEATSVRRPDGTKQIFSLLREGYGGTELEGEARSLHALNEMLTSAADSALIGIASRLGQPGDHYTSLAGDHVESTLAMMVYEQGGGGCAEHEDRGLLTIVAGPGACTLECYDRVAKAWVTPAAPSVGEVVVLFTGATLYRASAGLIPRASRDDAEGIGATLHRVPSSSSAADYRQSIVLRVRARLDAVLDCSGLRGEPAAVELFTDGPPLTVAQFYEQKKYVSVNQSVAVSSAELQSSATGSAAAVPAAPPAAKALDLTVRVVTQDGSQIYFKCRPTTPLSKLMERCCQRQGWARSETSFTYREVAIQEDDTPAKLGMGDDEVITVLNGWLSLFVLDPTSDPPSDTYDMGYLEVDVCPWAPLADSLGDLTSRLGHACCILSNGRVVDTAQTASELGLCEGDILIEGAWLVETVFDQVSERGIVSGLISQASLDRITDKLAASSGDDAGLPRPMLGHLQSLYLLLALKHSGNPHGCFEPRYHVGGPTAQLTWAEEQLRELLRANVEARAWCASMLSLLAEAEAHSRSVRKQALRENALATAADRRWERQQRAARLAEETRREAEAVAYAARAGEREEAAARWTAEVRSFMTDRLGEDAGAVIMHQHAATRIQSAARKLVYRRRSERRKEMGLCVIMQDGSEVYFKCRPTTPLGKLMNAFCQRQGVAMQSVRFLFDGMRLHPNSTPRDMDMEDGDVIDAMIEQGGD